MILSMSCFPLGSTIYEYNTIIVTNIYLLKKSLTVIDSVVNLSPILFTIGFIDSIIPGLLVLDDSISYYNIPLYIMADSVNYMLYITILLMFLQYNLKNHEDTFLYSKT